MKKTLKILLEYLFKNKNLSNNIQIFLNFLNMYIYANVKLFMFHKSYFRQARLIYN